MARLSFARVLKQKRLQNGLSQEELAHIAGLSMRSISLMECNKQQPTITTIEALAKALNITMTALIEKVEHDKHHRKDVARAPIVNNTTT